MDPIEPQINEIILKQNSEWLYFFRPHRVVKIHEPDEVIPALQEIEDLINDNEWHAAGFLSYEAAPAFDKSLKIHSRSDFPILWFGLYSAPRLISLPKPTSPKPALNWSPTVPRDTYNAAIDKIKDHIASGRTYQVNYTFRLRAPFNGDARDLWQALAPAQV